MLTPEGERVVEHALQMLAALLSYGRGGEVPRAQLLVKADKAIDSLKSISARYSFDFKHQDSTDGT